MSMCVGLVGCALQAQDQGEAREPDPVADRNAFEEALTGDWRQVFYDSCTGDWHDHWTLDGEIGTVTTTPEGMELRAGPEFGNDAHHMVLWTKDVFSGDIRIDYDYTRLDNETRCVNIIYVQATGSGKEPYAEDIADWAEMRRVPSMKTYFNHMNTYHISYAAYPNQDDATEDYVRARRYMPETRGLRGTDLEPDYFRSGLFQQGVEHRMTIVRRGNHLVMRVVHPRKTSYFHWHNTTFPPITSGRIGLRHMYTRSARYKNFHVSVPH